MVSVHVEKGAWRPEELRVVLHSSYHSLYFHSAPSHEITSILPLFSVPVLFYRILFYFQDHFHVRDRQRVQISTITNHKSDSIQKVLWCYSMLSELVSALVYSRKDEKTKCHNLKRKSYSSWLQALEIFAGVAILTRFATKSIHINVRGVHTRLRRTFDCLKQGKENLNFESCFYSIHLIFFPQQSICIFGDMMLLPR